MRMYIMQCMQFSLYSVALVQRFDTVQYTVYTVHVRLYTILCIQFSVDSVAPVQILDTMHYTRVYSFHCIVLLRLRNVRLHTVECSVNSVAPFRRQNTIQSRKFSLYCVALVQRRQTVHYAVFTVFTV